MKTLTKKILMELSQILKSVDETKIDEFVEILCDARKHNYKVLGYAAGRMGLSLQAFMMRLNHLGIESYFYGDTYIPPMYKNDIFVCCSNSGTTKSVFNILDIFKNKAAGKIVSFVGNESTVIAANSTLAIKFLTCNGGLNSEDDPTKLTSIQPMTTVTEQAMLLLFDLIALKLIDKLNINLVDTKIYHSNIE